MVFNKHTVAFIPHKSRSTHAKTKSKHAGLAQHARSAFNKRGFALSMHGCAFISRRAAFYDHGKCDQRARPRLCSTDRLWLGTDRVATDRVRRTLRGGPSCRSGTLAYPDAQSSCHCQMAPWKEAAADRTAATPASGLALPQRQGEHDSANAQHRRTTFNQTCGHEPSTEFAFCSTGRNGQRNMTAIARNAPA